MSSPSRAIKRSKAGTPMSPITATGETLTRFVREESRAAFLAEFNEVLKSRRMAVDPAAAIRVIVEPLLRRECRSEFAALIRKIRAAKKSEQVAPTQ
jgi:hypothetical protein